MRDMMRKGQVAAEYAILIAVAIAAFVGMQLYVKRGVQSKFKGVVDQLNFDSSPTGEAVLQYEPYYTAAGTSTTTFDTTQKDTGLAGGKVAITDVKDTTTRTGSSTQEVDLTQDDEWTGAKQ